MLFNALGGLLVWSSLVDSMYYRALSLLANSGNTPNPETHRLTLRRTARPQLLHLPLPRYIGLTGPTSALAEFNQGNLNISFVS